MSKMSRWTLRFRDAEVERDFLAHDLDGEARLPRLLLLALAVFLFVDPIFWLLDSQWTQAFALAEILLGFGALGLSAATLHPFVVRYLRPASVFGVVVMGFGIACLMYLAHGAFEKMLLLSVAVLMTANSVMPYGIVTKTIINVLTAAAVCTWAGLTTALSPMEARAAINITFMIVMMSTAVAYAFEWGKRQRYLAKTALRQLLDRVFPSVVARQLETNAAEPIVEQIDSVVVLFADLQGFTSFAAQRPASETLVELERLFARFDVIVAKYGLEKIKTIGDAYMAAAGAPNAHPDAAMAAAEAAAEMLDAAERLRILGGLSLGIRIGINIGPVIAGVIGTTRIHYDLWGETVNLAARLESTGVVGRIHASEAFARALARRAEFEPRGPVEIKGMGFLPTYLLVGPRERRARQEDAA